MRFVAKESKSKPSNQVSQPHKPCSPIKRRYGAGMQTWCQRHRFSPEFQNDLNLLCILDPVQLLCGLPAGTDQAPSDICVAWLRRAPSGLHSSVRAQSRFIFAFTPAAMSCACCGARARSPERS